MEGVAWKDIAEKSSRRRRHGASYNRGTELVVLCTCIYKVNLVAFCVLFSCRGHLQFLVVVVFMMPSLNAFISST